LKNNTLIILIPGFPASEQDSICLPFQQDFVRHLSFLHPMLNIKVLAFQYPFFKAVYRWHGVEVHAFNGRNRGGFRRLLLWRMIWRRVKKIIREEKVMGILNFWMGETALICQYASRRYHIPTFTWLMGQDARKNNRYVFITRPKRESLIALSDFLAEEFVRNNNIRPALTVPPGIDVASFPSLTRDRTIDILAVGSLIPLKQFDHLIGLVADIANSHPHMKVVICGEGPERDKLQHLIQDFHLTSQIELRGEMDHKRILELMTQSRMLVHPSAYEGFGVVILEALYAGAHVVSYCQPMHVHFRHHHIAKNREDMKNKIVALLENKEPDHDRVLSYPIEETCKKILSLYR